MQTVKQYIYERNYKRTTKKLEILLIVSLIGIVLLANVLGIEIR